MSGAANRSKQYKNAGKAEDARRRRAECSLELRKKKTDDLLMKRRNIIEEDLSADEESTSATVTVQQVKSPTKTLSLDEIVRIVTTVGEPTMEQLHSVVRSLRAILSGTKCPPLQEVFDAGLGRVVAQLLTIDDELTVFEAMWCLTNMLSSESQFVRAMTDLNVLPLILQHLASGSARVAEQSVWALANIFGDCAEFRDMCIEHGALDVLQKAMENFDKLSADYRRTVSWTLSNALRHKQQPLSVGVVRQVLNMMAVIFKTNDTASLRDCYWGISYATDSSPDTLNCVIESGVVPYFVGTLETATPELIPPVLRALGNIVASLDEHTQAVIETGLFEGDALMTVYENGTSSVRKETVWMVSNVCAGRSDQLQHIIDNNWLPVLLSALVDGDAKTQIEASYAISNVSHTNEKAPCMALANAGFAGAVAIMLGSTNPTIVVNLLDSLSSVLDVLSKFDRVYNEVLENFEEAEGVDKLEELQIHVNADIYQKAVDLISTHFNAEDENAIDAGKETSVGPDAQGVEKPFNF